MKACIVSCFDNYDNRTKYIEQYFSKKGIEVVHLISDYSHTCKKEIIVSRSNVKLVHVSPYKKNLSFMRIYSHRQFARKAYYLLNQIQPDVIYCLIPPNFAAHYMARYKKKHKNIKLLFDVFDLWPESMTLAKNFTVLKLPFLVWGNLRDNNLAKADYVFTECNLYQEKLKNVLKKVETSTLYITKEETKLDLTTLETVQHIHLCYLGTINNIIDIDMICKIIKMIRGRHFVTVHLIGTGSSKELFVEAIKNAGAKVIDYGIVYDDNEKYKIFSKCHFGLNIMKPTVCVGLTLKSLSYFEAGLPIINNIQADTSELVNKYEAGVNVQDGIFDLNEFETLLINYNQLRMNTQELFKRELSNECINKELSKKLDKLI